MVHNYIVTNKVTKEMHKSKNNVTSVDYKVDRENGIIQTRLYNVMILFVDIK